MKNRLRVIGIIAAGSIYLISIIIFFFYFERIKNFSQTFTYLIIVLSLIFFVGFLIFFIWLSVDRNQRIQSSIYDYINNVIEDNNLGLIIYTSNGKIVWTSSFVKKRFREDMLGKDINAVFNNFLNKSKNQKDDFIKDYFIFSNNGFTYDVKVFRQQNSLSIRDITLYHNMSYNYEKEKIVIGEIEIDNFQLFLSTLGEEDFFAIQSATVEFLDRLSKTLNFSYRQYVNGKFWLISNKETFDLWKRDSFKVFSDLSIDIKSDRFDEAVTLSVGFAYGTREIAKLNQMAKDALTYSKTRGGNQITTIEFGSKPVSYGSNSEIAISTSRSELNYVSKKLLEKLKNPLIKNIIIYGHKNADLDAIGSAFALGNFLVNYAREHHKEEKEFYIQNTTFDPTTERFIRANSSSISKNVFIKPSQANKITDKNTIVIMVDTAELSRIENPRAFQNSDKDNVFIFDHHRVVTGKPNFLSSGNDYIETSASSSCEIITDLIALNSLIGEKKMIDSFSAQMLLNGIYMDTNQFKKATTMKTFNAASILTKWGAIGSVSIETLKVSEKVFNIINEITQNVEEVRPGFFLVQTKKEIDSDVIAIAADNMLNIQGRKAVFVVAKIQGKDKFKMSARGVDNTNVQMIAEAVGGGGHFAAAAAESTGETLEEFVDNIRQAIVRVKNESNIS